MRVWYLPFCDLDGCDPKRPYVCFIVIFMVIKNLGAHPIWASNMSPEASISIHTRSRNTKICQFGITSLVKQDISSLNVSMYFFPSMNIINALEDRLQNRSNLILIKFFLGYLHNVHNTASNAIFHNDP